MEYTDKTYVLEDELTGTKPVLVDFYTAGETHSDETIPVVVKLRDKVDKKATVLLVDTTDNADLAEKYHIHAVPTFVLFKDGQEVWRTTGRTPAAELEDMLGRFE